MGTQLHVIIVDDSEEHALLLLYNLRQGGIEPVHERVDTADKLTATLAKQEWDIVLSDYRMPQFNGLDALKLTREKDPNLPFILISGTVGEDCAVEAMRQGANDYIIKGNLTRLVPAITREVREAVNRRARKQAEEALRERGEEWRTLFEQARDSILVLELPPDGPPVIRNANVAALRMYGYSHDELIGKPISFLDAEDGSASLITERRRWSQATEGALFEARHRRKDGSVFEAEASVREMTVDGKRLLIDISRDITERKMRECRQLLSMTILELLAETAHRENTIRDILFAIKQSTGIEAVGIRLREGEDYPHIEANGFSPDFLKRERCLFTRASNGEPLRDDSGKVVLECLCGDIICGRADPGLPFFTKGGSFWTNGTTELIEAATLEQRQTHIRNTCNKFGYESVALIPLRATDRVIGLLQFNDHRKGCFTLDMIEFFEGLGASIAIAIDRQTSEKEKVKLMTELRQSHRMETVGRLAGGVAHDFNNLLTVILGNCSFLLNDIPKNDPRHADVEQIRNTGERAANLTKQLLAFSRKQIMQPKVLDLNAGLMDMEKLLRRLIGEDVNLTVCCAKDLALVKADSGQMEQVVMNLAINARDAMPKGGHLSIETTNVDIASIRVLNHDAAMPPGRYILLTVSDTGTGMDAGTLEHIFEPFFTTKELGRGTGLGLATVYGIVKQSGGFIDVQGEPARGTTFKIFLPVAPAAFLEGEGEGEGEGEKKRHVEKNIYTILLVEDEAAVRCMTRRILNGAGYTVLEAASAREALKHSGEDFDVVLTDIILPDTSGVELVAKLKKDGQIEAIYMSGYTDNPNVRDVLSRPDNRFLQKPFTAEALLSKVREALAQDPNV
jgi:PAS domain S-box-containing protein